MMEELATVVAIKQNQITCVSQVKSTCSSCQQADTCGSGIVAKAIPKKQLSVIIPLDKALTSNTLKVGDCIILGIPEIAILQTAWQVYLWPLIGLIGFSALGQRLLAQQIFTHELMSLSLGVLGGYLGYRLAKFWQQRSGQHQRLQPKILRVLPNKTLVKSINIKEITS